MDFRNDVEENGRWVRYPDSFVLPMLIEQALKEHGKNISDIDWVGSSDGKCKKGYEKFARDFAEEVIKHKEEGFIDETARRSRVKNRDVHYFEFREKKELQLPGDLVIVGTKKWWFSVKEDCVGQIFFKYFTTPLPDPNHSSDWGLLNEPHCKRYPKQD